ncbi:nucleotidyltransferase domain-containing protein [Terriglobus saanensis]|uniref:Nucleotidyltransferase family protein n=1 Tax=Terriglobus saanensis (strain ATCC BAA-1853 / DSM 23119 / SP1PR4) TaxID=401053 RepID=E8UZW2_TERSS|nr:nucleotidyltransferase family protein [Terriglobus saanensis]ADV81039.1 hypothetical protein AciPR4_0201 [Terriglobus saanensis SP1PR4]
MQTVKSWLEKTPIEFQVVVAACCGPQTEVHIERLERLLRSSIDWSRLLRIAHRNRVKGLVFSSLSTHGDLVPLVVLEELKAASLTLLRDNVIAARYATYLTEELAASGIRVATVKGAPLGQKLYGALNLRHGKDIDLLIPEASLEAADAVLRCSGHIRSAPPPSATPHELQAYRIYRSHYEYEPGPGKPQVELHWRLHLNPCFGPLSYPETEWQTIAFAPGIRVRTLGDLDLLCYLCAHGSTHAWSRLKWIVDIAAMLRSDPDLAAPFLERSRQQNTERAACQALMMAHDLFGTPLPSTVPAPGIAVRLLHRIAQKTLTFGGAEQEIAEGPFLLRQVYFSQLLLSTSFRQLLTGLHNQLLAPAASRGSLSSRAARVAAPLRFVYRWLWRTANP